MTRFFLYLFRWQLSTPILSLVVWLISESTGAFVAAAVANLIGGCIFFWVDKWIFSMGNNEITDTFLSNDVPDSYTVTMARTRVGDGEEFQIFDYGFVLQGFQDGLWQLRDHIEEHNLIQDMEEVVAEIDHAIWLLEKCDEYSSLEEEMKAWNDLWDFIKENMRKWWD